MCVLIIFCILKQQKSLKNLTEQISQPLIDVALKSLKCDLNKMKDKVALHNERSNLVKPDDTTAQHQQPHVANKNK